MNIQYILSVSIFAIFTSGCCLPIGDTYYTATKISPELINSIVSDNTIPVSERNIPDEIRAIEGNTVDIYFKDDFCACGKQRFPSISVSLVSKTGLSGYQNYEYSLRYLGRGNDKYDDACSSFAEADKAITDAESTSENYEFFISMVLI